MNNIIKFSLPLGRETGERGREKVLILSLAPPYILYRGERAREKETGKIIDKTDFYKL